MNIYVGNLPYSIRDDELRATFATFGDVESAEVIVDRRTRRSRGYGFVKMKSDEAGRKAIQALDGHELQGRALRVDQSKPKAGSEASAPRTQRKAQAATPRPEPATPAVAGGGGLFGFFKKLFG
mgnify:CR=1 FL=1